MKWLKEVGRGIRDNAAYEIVRLVVIAICFPAAYGAWRLIAEQPVRLGVLISLGAIGLLLLVMAGIRLRNKGSRILDPDVNICKFASLQEPSHQTPVREFNWKALEIEALPAIPNTKNLTQLGWKMRGRPPFDADCIFSVHNPNPAQGIDGIAFRLLSVKPELTSFRGFDPPTEDVHLRRLQFGFNDVPGSTLNGDQQGQICVFRATRKPVAEESLKNIRVEFGGNWPEGSRNEFIPERDHILTVEVTANGLPRTEVQFHVSFSTKPDEPVFTARKLFS